MLKSIRVLVDKVISIYLDQVQDIERGAVSLKKIVEVKRSSAVKRIYKIH